jgi:hypothetical protein
LTWQKKQYVWDAPKKIETHHSQSNGERHVLFSAQKETEILIDIANTVHEHQKVRTTIDWQAVKIQTR